jgi:serine phosphatase RsbU (regulator of sigma subunit)
MVRTLWIRSPDGTKKKIALEQDRYVLGRSHEADLCYPEDTSLSRRHLKIDRDGDDWWIEDLGSKNGTHLNDERLAGRRRLMPGDQVSAGHLVIVYEDPFGDLAGRVTFYSGSDEDLPPNATVFSSLEGVLSLERASTGSPHPGFGGAVASGGGRAGLDARAARALLQAGLELAHRRPLPELFSLILDLSIEAVRAERGVLLTLEKDGLATRAVKGGEFRISTAVIDRVIQNKASLLVRDTRLDDLLKNRQSISGQNIRTLLAVPLQTSDRVIGLIYVDSPTLVSELTPGDLDLLTVLANVAANRIEQERLVQVEEAEKFHSQELQQAAEIQRGLLPDRAPDVPGLEIAGHNAPCQTVGGDYYDFFLCRDGQIALVLADVSGKGLPAALLMASVQARVEVLLEDAGDLPQLLSRLDRMMADNCPKNRFVTLFLCVLNPETGEVVYCNAGHNPPFVVRVSGLVERLIGSGTMLGIFPELGYEQRRCRLDAGDFLVLYSDGVSEAEDPSGEEFGDERLAALLADSRGIAASEILERVKDAVTAWTAGAPAADDVTVVVARRTA